MTEPAAGTDGASMLSARVYRLFREFFDLAEKRRRWSLTEDIPWGECTRSTDPVVADLVETFCSVEMYLPDYVSKLIPQVREQRGRSWFLAGWGYEESKHSLALEDWLLRSGSRSDEQMADLAGKLYQQEWEPPYDTSLGMVCYTMMQELATWLHYRNLRMHVRTRCPDPALDRILALLMIDERAHYDFFKQVVKLHLEYDRATTLEQIRMVCNQFQMPSYHLLLDSKRRSDRVRELNLFNEEIFYFQVFEPYLAALGLSRGDLRGRRPKREVVQG